MDTDGEPVGVWRACCAMCPRWFEEPTMVEANQQANEHFRRRHSNKARHGST